MPQIVCHVLIQQVLPKNRQPKIAEGGLGTLIRLKANRCSRHFPNSSGSASYAADFLAGVKAFSAQTCRSTEPQKQTEAEDPQQTKEKRNAATTIDCCIRPEVAGTRQPPGNQATRERERCGSRVPWSSCAHDPEFAIYLIPKFPHPKKSAAREPGVLRRLAAGSRVPLGMLGAVPSDWVDAPSDSRHSNHFPRLPISPLLKMLIACVTKVM